MLGLGTLIPLGASLFGGLFGGGGKYEMSPESKKLYNLLMQQYQGAVPEHVLAPIRRSGEQQVAGIKDWFGSNLPAGTASGLELANIMRSRAGTQRAIGEASSAYKSDLLRQLQGVAGQQQYRPNMLGQAFGNIGGSLFQLMYLKKLLGGQKQGQDVFQPSLGGQGTGLQYSPGFLGK